MKMYREMIEAYNGRRDAEAARCAQHLWQNHLSHCDPDPAQLTLAYQVLRCLKAVSPPAPEADDVLEFIDDIRWRSIGLDRSSLVSSDARNDFPQSARIVTIPAEEARCHLPDIADAYWSGAIIVIDGLLFPDIDYGVFDGFSALGPEENVHKAVIKGSHESMVSGGLLAEMVDESGRRARIQEVAVSLDAAMKAWFNMQFTDAARDTTLTTWRFTHTSGGPYHFDTYAGSPVRGFMNLDREARVWGWGHRRSDVLDSTLIDVGRLPGDTIGEQNNYLNLILEIQEHKERHFEHLDFWLCDTLNVAHQIIHGRKMAGFSYT